VRKRFTRRMTPERLERRRPETPKMLRGWEKSWEKKGVVGRDLLSGNASSRGRILLSGNRPERNHEGKKRGFHGKRLGNPTGEKDFREEGSKFTAKALSADTKTEEGGDLRTQSPSKRRGGEKMQEGKGDTKGAC